MFQHVLLQRCIALYLPRQGSGSIIVRRGASLEGKILETYDYGDTAAAELVIAQLVKDRVRVCQLNGPTQRPYRGGTRMVWTINEIAQLKPEIAAMAHSSVETTIPAP